MKLEELPPQNLFDNLNNRRNQLEQIIQLKTSALENTPAGKLYVSKSNNTIQFYLAHKATQAPAAAATLTPTSAPRKKRNYHYVKRGEENLIRALCQKEYDQNILEKSQKELAAINTLQQLYQAKETMPECKMKYVKPATLTDEAYANAWKNIPFTANEDFPQTDFYETSFDLKVRSKSELMIAEMLHSKKVPFRYEMQVLLDKCTVHPDFCCLNVRTRQEFLWEHFGLMDNPEYAQNAVTKLNEYADKGYTPGINFIATFETASNPLNTKRILQVLNTYLI